MRPLLRHGPRLSRPARPLWRTAARVAQSTPAAGPCRPSQRSRQLSTTPALQHTHPASASASSSSVNETEISHFSALAASWWDPHGPSRPLHLMNPLRHDFIRTCLSSSPSSSSSPPALRYLDVGCGGGIFAESAARLPSTLSVTAIDPSPTILAVARAHARRDPALGLGKKLVYLNETIESLPVPESPAEGFDVVSLFEVIEHVDYPAAFLDRVGQFVRPGGWLVLSTIARTWTSWVTTNLVAEDLLGMVPKGTHDWNKYINERELRGYFDGQDGVWGVPMVMGVVYVPGLGWKEVRGSEEVGNYFFGVQRVA
ncbi:S-adenosyl-L-methionine-dependent methyltransferase [Achaetomium macrosporum]|uniref:Ubiquinone biosynthesis O-methyltransferase, mitochondrial n=1 Tax=Achaetomium macrosporum TaxID=79813 RepID=A0AAN7C455_9PEZI|nr:S-adenosyl-L-methionine-dependent methyltransferase [Achaetomium macrosporum]